MHDIELKMNEALVDEQSNVIIYFTLLLLITITFKHASFDPSYQYLLLPIISTCYAMLIGMSMLDVDNQSKVSIKQIYN